jgi:hypothetical protein
VARGLAADPHDRGSAAAFALDLRHACRPEPVRLPRSGVPDDELALTGRGPRTELTHQVPTGRHREVVVGELRARRARGRRLLAAGVAAAPRAGVVVLVLAVLAAGLWLGARWGDDEVATSAVDRPAATSSASRRPPAPARVDTGTAPADLAGWRTVLDELYRRRAAAFTGGEVAALDEVYTTGSPLRAADERSIADLAAAGEVLRGFAPAVVEVTAARPDGDEVRVELSDRWPRYAVVAAGEPDGPPVRSEPGRGVTPNRMELVRTAHGWRIDTAERLR